MYNEICDDPLYKETPNEEYKYEKLDMSWILNFENTDKEYKSFYKDDLSRINIHFIYVNTSNEIQRVKKCFFSLKPLNCLTKENIINILKKNSIVNNIRYKLQSILQYNIDIDPQNLSMILKNNPINFLNIIKNIDDITWKKTIKIFQDLNDLFFIFYENNIFNTSKKIYLTNKLRTIHHNKTIKKCI